MEQKNELIGEKFCTNCRYFFQHYVNYNGKFSTTNCAHCSIRHISLKRLGQLIKDKQACELWESDAARKETQKNYVENEIARLTALLEDYVQMLKLK